MKNAIIFAAGLAIGGGISYWRLRSFYESKIISEAAEVKEYYNEKLKEATEQKPVKEEPVKEEKPKTKPKKEPAKKQEDEMEEYTAQAGVYDYTAISSKKSKSKKKTAKASNEKPKPEIITPDEYDQSNGYWKLSLTYFEGDETVINEDEEIVDDVSYLIGDEWKNHIGDYEDGVVYIRNANISSDFVVIYDSRSYQQFMGEE